MKTPPGVLPLFLWACLLSTNDLDTMWANLQILFWLALFSGLSLKGQSLVMDSGFEGADPALRSGSWVAVAGTPDYYNTSLPDSNTNYGLEQFSNAVEGNVYLGVAGKRCYF